LFFSEQLEFGDGSNVTLNTYYIRMVAEDDKGNQAEHSNSVSLTIADPQTINLWVSWHIHFLLVEIF